MTKTNPEIRILVVDDQRPNIVIMTAILKKLGHICETAGNGIEALEKIDSSPDFDFIFMDCNMPLLSGKEAIRNIRVLNKKAAVKIICMSSKYSQPNHSGQRLKPCVVCGINHILGKPFSLVSVKQILNSSNNIQNLDGDVDCR